MGELASALDALTVDDLYELGAAGLLDRTAELVLARNRIDAELAPAVCAADLLQAPELRWTTGAPNGSFRRPCAGRSRPVTGTASSPAARRPATGAASIMSSNGSSTRATPTWATPPCSANATTPRSITDSGTSDHPTADGAPGAPTEPRSSSDHTCSQPEPALRPGRPGRTGDYLRRSAAPEFGSER